MYVLAYISELVSEHRYSVHISHLAILLSFMGMNGRTLAANHTTRFFKKIKRNWIKGFSKK